MDAVFGLLALLMLCGSFLAVVLGAPVILLRDFRFERRIRRAIRPVHAPVPRPARPIEPRQTPDGMRAVLWLLEEQRRHDRTA
jgi:hypothetical protein